MSKRLLPIVERAVVFADAALDEPTEQRINLARATIHGALERIEKSEFAGDDARAVASFAGRLRALLHVIERRASQSPDRLLS